MLHHQRCNTFATSSLLPHCCLVNRRGWGVAQPAHPGTRSTSRSVAAAENSVVCSFSCTAALVVHLHSCMKLGEVLRSDHPDRSISARAIAVIFISRRSETQFWVLQTLILERTRNLLLPLDPPQLFCNFCGVTCRGRGSRAWSPPGSPPETAAAAAAAPANPAARATLLESYGAFDCTI